MNKTQQDALAAMRERVASSRQRPGYHPYWTTAPVVADEPLWAISFRVRPSDEWLGPYNTVTRDLDEAIDEAREYLRAPKRAKSSVHPTVPRSDTYRGAKATLTAMMLAVPLEHPAASDMLDQLQAALRVVSDAEAEGRYFGGLAINLPIALEVDELRAGRPRSMDDGCAMRAASLRARVDEAQVGEMLDHDAEFDPYTRDHEHLASAQVPAGADHDLAINLRV
jgi:hypothetical protein